ncbi:unnamed protein product [Closterium sp. NIES-64]|nr:unnamed protein product [Closterium sp. NIES-64]
MSLGGTTGDNTRLLGQAPEEEEEMEAEGVKEVAVATSLEVLYQETPNYRGAVAEVDRMIDPRETARHAWRVPDLGVDPAVSAGEEAELKWEEVEKVLALAMRRVLSLAMVRVLALVMEKVLALAMRRVISLAMVRVLALVMEKVLALSMGTIQ